MTPTAIIEQAAAEGVMLALAPSDASTLKVLGDRAAVDRWRPVLREHKSAIVKALLESCALTGDLDAIRAWLSFIGENDPAILADVLARCGADADARHYFNGRAGEMLPPVVNGARREGERHE